MEADKPKESTNENQSQDTKSESKITYPSARVVINRLDKKPKNNS